MKTSQTNTRPQRSVSLALSTLLSLGMLSGCKGSLEADDWTGLADCNGYDISPFQVEMQIVADLDKNEETTYRAHGKVEGLRIFDGAQLGFEVLFAAELRQLKRRKTQELEFDVFSCTEQNAYETETPYTECWPMTGEWDGDNTLIGQFEDFLGSSYTCDYELTRSEPE